MCRMLVLAAMLVGLTACAGCREAESDVDDAVEGLTGKTAVEAGAVMERQLDEVDAAARSRIEEIEKIDGGEPPDDGGDAGEN